jgi:hypothetical protein
LPANRYHEKLATFFIIRNLIFNILYSETDPKISGTYTARSGKKNNRKSIREALCSWPAKTLEGFLCSERCCYIRHPLQSLPRAKRRALLYFLFLTQQFDSSAACTERSECIGMTNTKLGLSSRLRRDEASIRIVTLFL